jgi:hypothetical protein
VRLSCNLFIFFYLHTRFGLSCVICLSMEMEWLPDPAGRYAQGLGRQQLTSRTKRRSSVVRASWSPSDSLPPSSSIAPLRMESPAGQLLSQILHTHPHLLPAPPSSSWSSSRRTARPRRTRTRRAVQATSQLRQGATWCCTGGLLK